MFRPFLSTIACTAAYTAAYTAVAILAPLGSIQAQDGAGVASVASQYGLDQAWATRVRVDYVSARITHVTLTSGLLLVQNSRAGLEAIDAETGRSLWSTVMGRPTHPSIAATANAQFVTVANGSQLYALERSTGVLSWTAAVKGSPSCGGAMTADRVYVPMLSGAIESYKLVRTDAVERAPVIFFGSGAAESPPLATGTHLMWGTNKGNVYIDGATSSSNRVRFIAGGSITGAVAYRSPRVFATSLDGHAYALDETSGAKLWQFSGGSPIREQPVSIGDVVYVTTDAGGLYQLAADAGSSRWFVPGITHFVAASAKRVYAADRIGRIFILDAASGARLGMLPTELLPIQPTNIHTDRMYLGTRTGYLACFHERGLVQPINQDPPPPKKEEKSSKKKAAEPSAEEAPAEQPAAPPADANNPFAK
jgi:outer membrane protein assembly factor BamB